MTNNCIFCRIVAGDAQASIVFEDEDILAFQTIRQTRPGETLIIPKQHIDHFCDIDDDVAARITALAQRIARAMRRQLAPKRVGYVVSGFGVAHAHLIVIPLHEEQDITSQRFITVEEGVARFGMDHIPPTPREALDQMAASLGRDL